MPDLDSALDKPRDRFHDLANLINSSAVATAMIRKEVEHAGAGIGRIEATLGSLQAQMSSLKEDIWKVDSEMRLKIAHLQQEVGGVKQDIKAIDERYALPKNIVYGMVTLILVAVVVALIALVIPRP